MFSGRVLLVPLLVLCCAFHLGLGLRLIVPGTKWCGLGNIAKNYDDLGTDRDLDMCCRTHDHCAEHIPPHGEAHGLKNYGMFPIFPCTCDSAFRSCLAALGNYHSLAVGRLYFNTKNVCFAYGHPIVSCRETQTHISENRCLSYEVDKGQPKQWQFYDMAPYTQESSEDSQD